MDSGLLAGAKMHRAVRCLTSMTRTCAATRTAASLSTPEPIQLHTPLTPKKLLTIQSLLAESGTQASSIPVLDNDHQLRRHTTAAVLMPLCNVNGQPGILFQVRGQLRTHGGQISFPGGKIDKTDMSPENAAIRETWEEMGIHPKNIHVLNRMESWQELSLGGRLQVLPIIGYISPPRDNDHTFDPIPSLEISSLTLSATEVAHVFHLPFSDILTSSSRLRHQLFRGTRPYYAVDVSDKIPRLTTTDIEDNRLEVWGLTGWYLSLFMRAIGVW